MPEITVEMPVELRQYVEAIFVSNEKRYIERFLAQEKAIAVAEANSDKWRANANEWRAAMMDRESKFATKAEFDFQFHAMNERISKMEMYRADQEGSRSGLKSGWGLVIGVCGFILTLLVIYNTVRGFSK